MTAFVSEQLLAALDDLHTEDLKRFKWHLKNQRGFPSSALEKADAPDTVDLMMKSYGPEEAVRITVDVLRNMKHNDVAEQLEKKHKQAPAEGRIEEPALAGAASNPPEVTFSNIVPKTRNDFLQHSRQLTLDLNTVNEHLRLSERNRVITNTRRVQSYPHHEERFNVTPQVLCRESVSGRCYWEVKWSGDDDDDDDDAEYVSISVSYKSISRRDGEDKCWFGYNNQSWSLYCSHSHYSFRHDNLELHLPVKSISSRVGVYVDHSAGTLSFYSVSGYTMILIHTVQTTFTKPLYPGFGVPVTGSSVKLC